MKTINSHYLSTIAFLVAIILFIEANITACILGIFFLMIGSYYSYVVRFRTKRLLHRNHSLDNKVFNTNREKMEIMDDCVLVKSKNRLLNNLVITQNEIINTKTSEIGKMNEYQQKLKEYITIYQNDIAIKNAQIEVLNLQVNFEAIDQTQLISLQ